MRRRHPRTLGRTQPGTLPRNRRQHRRARRQAQAVQDRLRGGDQAPRVRVREVEGKRTSAGQPPPHCLKTLPAPARHERWRNRSARLPSNDLPAPAYRGFEITTTRSRPHCRRGTGGGEGTRLPCARIHSRASFEKLQKRRQSFLQIKGNTLWHYSTIDSPSPLKFNSNST